MLVGEDAIDYDMTLKSMNAAAGTALVEVKHVPPKDSALPIKAGWMQEPVGAGANNWVEIVKTSQGNYEAGVGIETFTVNLTVGTADGHIVSATMENPVTTMGGDYESRHDVRLIPAKFIKPHRKSNKNDFIDAEAIAEAAGKENIRFVTIKSEEQLDVQAMHRVRDRLVQRRTALIDEIRGFLLERGMTFAVRTTQLRKKLPRD